MLKKSALTLLFITAGSGSMAAFGDHNSKWGEGWANMPNDIHNTRVETRGDNTAFRDFVRQGNGADSVNRFSTRDSRVRKQQLSTRSQRATTTSVARGGRGRN
ncbi:hypothetical protein [Eudoraea sp.]|uniref:hypothetical protein n=1 Tax=Eudoraea sp. TaxID=1979955 RepID=UPI003C758A3C